MTIKVRNEAETHKNTLIEMILKLDFHRQKLFRSDQSAWPAVNNGDVTPYNDRVVFKMYFKMIKTTTIITFLEIKT